MRQAKLSVGLLAVLLAGCQTAELPEPSATASDAHELRSPGKVTAPVEISYEFLSEPRLGQPLEIQISTRALRPNASVAFEVRGDASLSLAGQSAFMAQRLPLEEPRLDQVVVTPMSEGRSFLDVMATVTLNGAQIQKAISIPIDVGVVIQPQAETQLDAAGKPVRSMPAEETTSE